MDDRNPHTGKIYNTYEELKLNGSVSITLDSKRFIIPMRNWNDRASCLHRFKDVDL